MNKIMGSMADIENGDDGEEVRYLPQEYQFLQGDDQQGDPEEAVANQGLNPVLLEALPTGPN